MPQDPTNRRSVLALLLVLASGCSAPSSGGGAAPHPHAERVTLELGEVADTAALLAALAADPFVQSGRDTALLVIDYDSTGALSRAMLEHAAAAEADVQRLRELLVTLLSASSVPGARGWFMLERGESPRIQPFEWREEVMPRMQNRPEIARTLRVLSADRDLLGRRITVTTRVGNDGSVSEARVVRSTGSVRADQALLDLTRRVRFTPGRLDRFPVSVWVQFDLQILEDWGGEQSPRS